MDGDDTSGLQDRWYTKTLNMIVLPTEIDLDMYVQIVI